MFHGTFSSQEIRSYISKAYAMRLPEGAYLNLMKRKDAEVGLWLEEMTGLPFLRKRFDIHQLSSLSDKISLFQGEKVA